MTGDDLARWMESKGLTKSEFERLGGPTANTVRSMIRLGDRQIPEWVDRTCFWVSLPEDLRSALWKTYGMPTP